MDLRQAISQAIEAVRPQIESRGGEVMAQYRAAYNGMKVRIAADRVHVTAEPCLGQDQLEDDADDDKD